MQFSPISRPLPGDKFRVARVFREYRIDHSGQDGRSGKTCERRKLSVICSLNLVPYALRLTLTAYCQLVTRYALGSLRYVWTL